MSENAVSRALTSQAFQYDSKPIGTTDEPISRAFTGDRISLGAPAVTNEDVYKAADIFLKALDAAPIGTGAMLKDVASKNRMETLALRAVSKLYAASYHCSNVARLVQRAH